MKNKILTFFLLILTVVIFVLESFHKFEHHDHTHEDNSVLNKIIKQINNVIISLQTIQGKARITKATVQTITGKASILEAPKKRKYTKNELEIIKKSQIELRKLFDSNGRTSDNTNYRK